jgi:DNA helicase-2/ATP-dependent DNA helicase PcrA
VRKESVSFENIQGKIYAAASESCCQGIIAKTKMENFSAYQLAAVQSAAPRTLVLSAAGSGKTRVLVGRVQWLVEQRVCAPGEIAAVTFTTHAAKVMVDRIGFKIGFAGTLHSLLLRLANQHAEVLGLAPNVGVVDEEQRAVMLETLCAEHRFRGTKEQVDAAVKEHSFNPRTPAQLVAAAYWWKLRDANALDFDGIMAAGKLAVRYARDKGLFPFRVLLVDEYQDCSDDHAAVYDLMPVEQRFVCGDRNQAIFSFLGGDVNQIVTEQGKATVFRCETNYRCCKAVCRAAEEVVKAGGGTERTLPRPDAPEGDVAVFEAPDFEAEVKWIARRLRETDSAKDAAVLLRTNALCAQYALALESYGFVVAKKGQSAAPPDWAAVKALLFLLPNPDNDMLAENFVAALKGKEQAAESRRCAAAAMASVNDSCLHLPRLADAHRAVGYVSSTKPSAESLARLHAALALLDGDATVGDLLVALAEPPKPEESRGLRVTTYHAAKGTEYDAVFMPAFEEGILPSTRDAGSEAALAEARRLVYVGVTRARTHLGVSWCRTRQEAWGRRDTTERQPSRFLKDLQSVVG